MRDVTMQETNWNTHHFAVGGAFAGGAYVFLICNLLGLIALATLSTVFISVVGGSLLGAGIAGGVAAARNCLAAH
jgi:hypothetical protein